MKPGELWRLRPDHIAPIRGGYYIAHVSGLELRLYPGDVIMMLAEGRYLTRLGVVTCIWGSEAAERIDTGEDE